MEIIGGIRGTSQNDIPTTSSGNLKKKIYFEIIVELDKIIRLVFKDSYLQFQIFKIFL